MKIDLNNEKVASINYKNGIDYFTLTINKGFIDFAEYRKEHKIHFINRKQCYCYRTFLGYYKNPTIFEDIMKILQYNNFVVYIRNNYGDKWQIYKNGIEKQWSKQ